MRVGEVFPAGRPAVPEPRGAYTADSAPDPTWRGASGGRWSITARTGRGAVRSENGCCRSGSQSPAPSSFAGASSAAGSRPPPEDPAASSVPTGDGPAGTTASAAPASCCATSGAVPSTLEHLRGKGFSFLASVHGVDYFPEEPRLGVHYELLDMREVDRISVRTRVTVADPHVPSVTPQWPTADHQEREIYDMFGVVFDGHPDLRRILMPEDYEGHPQRRDFPIGGEPVLFTHNERTTPEWWE